MAAIRSPGECAARVVVFRSPQGRADDAAMMTF
jgi:hypothetical protein